MNIEILKDKVYLKDIDGKLIELKLIEMADLIGNPLEYTFIDIEKEKKKDKLIEFAKQLFELPDTHSVVIYYDNEEGFSVYVYLYEHNTIKTVEYMKLYIDVYVDRFDFMVEELHEDWEYSGNVIFELKKENKNG